MRIVRVVQRRPTRHGVRESPPLRSRTCLRPKVLRCPASDDRMLALCGERCSVVTRNKCFGGNMPPRQQQCSKKHCGRSATTRGGLSQTIGRDHSEMKHAIDVRDQALLLMQYRAYFKARSFRSCGVAKIEKLRPAKYPYGFRSRGFLTRHPRRCSPRDARSWLLRQRGDPRQRRTVRRQ